MPFKIETFEDVEKIPAIGDRIRDKIKEIITTGKLQKAEAMIVRKLVRIVFNDFLER